MATGAKVRAALQQLLPTVDLDTVTERRIREILTGQIGDVSKHHKLIKDEIEKFLCEAAEDECGDDDEEYSAEDESDEEARPASKKQKNMKGDAVRTSTAPETKPGEFMLQLAPRKFLRVSQFKGAPRVDVREYYEKDGQMMPGASGLSLSIEQWNTLHPQLPSFLEGFSQGNSELCVDLSDMRRGYLSEFKGKLSMHLREFYQAPDGQLKPGKKGVTLDENAVQVLLDAVPKVCSTVQGFPAPKPAKTSASTVPTPSTAPSASGAPPTAPNAASAKGGPAGMIDLGGEKRVSVNKYKDMMLVDFREYYKKGDELLPGKKGVSIQKADWELVCAHMGEISAAAERKDMNFTLKLGGKKQVSISEFKGKVYVGVREFYEKDGKLLPGAKGLNMTAEQWQKVAEGMHLITASL